MTDKPTNFELDRAILRQIVEGEPDTRLPAHLQRAVPWMVARKWLMVCGCSDGDYVKATKRGLAVLGLENQSHD